MSAETVAVRVKRLPHAAGLPLPTYATADAAGADLLAAIDDDLVIAPGERSLVPTGLTIALPTGFEGQVRPRSGLALRHGLTVLNTPGTIDADYRGEVGVLLVNLGTEPVTVSRGMRIAQLVVARHARLHWIDGTLDETGRGSGGFGSTGTGAPD